MKITNQKKLTGKYNSFLFFFIFVVLYNFVVVNDFSFWKVSEITYSYHIVDYSFGFCTKFLPGAIYGFFFDKTSELSVTIFETIILMSVFALVSLFLSKIIRLYSDSPDRKNILIIFLFYLSGPCTFAMFSDELGMLDVYWLLFSALFFICLQSRASALFIPLIFVLSILVHFSCLISYLILFVIVLLYSISIEKNKKIFWFILFVSAIITIILFIYFFKNENANLKYNLGEFNNLLKKYSGHDDVYNTYYDYALYKFYNGKYFNDILLISDGGNLPAVVVKTINTLYSQIVLTVALSIDSGSFIQLGLLFALCLPVIIFLYYFLHSHKKMTDNRLKKFSILIAQLQFPFTFLISCLFSPDTSRWFTHAFLIIFSFCLYLVYKEKEVSISVIKTFISKIKPLYIAVYYLLYATAYFQPYR